MPECTSDKLHSAILYGPPGTGKTTLIEALAKTANVPLVEVTPSDILLAGEEKVETRARVVFEALSMLSNVVILLDEFDRVLWDRTQADSSSMFQFLTPGMLPKLKKLYDQAERQRTVFVLSTNLIGGLDPAAIREGRFDKKIGVFPPDVLSRAGRLSKTCNIKAMNLDIATRFPEIVVGSAGLGMNTLGKPGWFTATKDELTNTPIDYLKNGGKKPVWPKPEKFRPRCWDDDYVKVKVKTTKNAAFPNGYAMDEWQEWIFVDALDQFANKNPHALYEELENFLKQLWSTVNNTKKSHKPDLSKLLQDASNHRRPLQRRRKTKDRSRK